MLSHDRAIVWHSALHFPRAPISFSLRRPSSETKSKCDVHWPASSSGWHTDSSFSMISISFSFLPSGRAFRMSLTVLCTVFATSSHTAQPMYFRSALLCRIFSFLGIPPICAAQLCASSRHSRGTTAAAAQGSRPAIFNLYDVSSRQQPHLQRIMREPKCWYECVLLWWSGAVSKWRGKWKDGRASRTFSHAVDLQTYDTALANKIHEVIPYTEPSAEGGNVSSACTSGFT
mmetsp:Transcript_13210/g.37244  ORF Transcript_13210/g.37244 Transcript_13210/m.37244 type:complete len:231 (-) Transcript_13210:65-757(-)